MKKLLMLLIVGTISLTACSSEPVSSDNADKKEKIEIEVVDGDKNSIQAEFPIDPERVVVLNWQTVDFLDSIGKGDKIVGVIKNGVYPAHLEKYVLDNTIVDVGTMHEANMEAIMSLQPDIIFSSDRSVGNYENFIEIAPTMAAYVDYSDGFMNGYKTLAKNHSLIFNVESELDGTIANYEERISNISEFANGKTALLGIFAGGINTLGDSGRCSIIVNEMGFDNLAGGDNVNHGNVSSYEAWLDFNPEYMFVLDKDTAVGTEAIAAKDQMEINNPVIEATTAYKNGNIIYLEPGDVWYIADGGITSLDLMISNIEEGLGLK